MRKKLLRCLSVSVSWVVVLGAAAAAGTSDERLITAAQHKDVETIRALLKAGVDVNAKRADGVTALHWAAHWDDGATADLLLRAGADVNAGEGQGVTPLILACENASDAMAARLLAAGANPNTPSMASESVLARGSAELRKKSSESSATTSMTSVPVRLGPESIRHQQTAR